VNDIEDAIRGAVFDGMRLRVRTDDGGVLKRGSLCLSSAKEAVGYRIHPELAHIVSAAALQPIGSLSNEDAIEIATLSPMEEAREFVQMRVQRPALQNPLLPPSLKKKVKHSDTWLQQFKRVGDLYAYLQRFNKSRIDPVHLELKSYKLETFEDIRHEFAERFSVWCSDRTLASDFVIGQRYSGYDILIFTENYDTRAGGMFVIKKGGAPSLVVIKATLSGGKYENSWINFDERLKYYFKSIGEEFGAHYVANAAILENPEIPIFTFVRKSSIEDFVFHGVFTYAADHIEAGGARWFELVRNNQPSDIQVDGDYLRREFMDRVAASLADSKHMRSLRLANAKSKPARITVCSTEFVRNPDVVAEVLERAGGVCESCKRPGPFISKAKGTPFLEVHHVVHLADGGDDTVENALAVCPNCHREKHYG